MVQNISHDREPNTRTLIIQFFGIHANRKYESANTTTLKKRRLPKIIKFIV